MSLQAPARELLFAAEHKDFAAPGRIGTGREPQNGAAGGGCG